MTEIHPKLVFVLREIDFIGRYKQLSDNYRNEQNCFGKFETNKVLNIIQTFGNKVSYNKSERFFKINEKQNDFEIQFNIILKYGVCEFVWAVKYLGEFWPIGGPWGLITDFLLQEFDEETRFPLPVFSSYEELEEILKQAFHIYEDFKHELMLQEYGK